MQVMKHASEGIHPGFETQGRPHLKSKTEVSVIPQKALCPIKIFLKNKLLAVPPELIQVCPPNVLMHVSLSPHELLPRHSFTSENNKD